MIIAETIQKEIQLWGTNRLSYLAYFPESKKQVKLDLVSHYIKSSPFYVYINICRNTML